MVELERYEERVIVFIDILGFREHIRKTTTDQSHFIRLRDTLNFISNLKTENNGDVDKEITVFSDSIVISYPADLPGAVFSLLLDVIHIQIELMGKGIIMRGGITVGQLCHKDNIVYGPAMVEAYELESKSAIYPRVTISEKTFITAIQYPVNSKQEDLEWLDGLVRKDRDGQWYVDFLNQQQEIEDEYDYYKALYAIRTLIIEEISNNIKRPNIRMKYEWLKYYFNDVVDNLTEDLDLYIKDETSNENVGV